MKIKVATTSTSCLDYYSHNYDIDIIRIKILIGDVEYIDGDTMKYKQFYQMFQQNPDFLPKTSQVSVGEMVVYFEKLISQGYQKVFITTLASTLSGTYNAIIQAKKIVADKIEVYCYDTQTVCFCEGYFALQAYQLFQKGHSLEEVIKTLDLIKGNNTIFFITEKLTQLIKNGRLSGVRSFFGRLLRIKPILQVQSTGKIALIQKTLNTNKSFLSIVNKIKDYTQGYNYQAHLLFTGDTKLRDDFKVILEKNLGLKNLLEIPLTPVIGCHVGNNVIGVGIIRQN
ncbi:DegV family protein [Candidatus Phytoplasma australiense]|uniref:DegV family protein n=2 Tax=Phytoplasma australiense TaxID=59748 RepID=B1V9E1_PHYAS|nr:DegV family protein [Candidatus Phytoplasma australiense]AGL89939.1 DegV Family Protein [Strawberry lethal yellows phytoplasma (CPA) str. NZSb11]CAM11342.1 DegV family protein [Candidatus Phytoplasma australiense]